MVIDMTDQSIELIDYDPTWQMRLTVLLASWLAGEVEHVGSTVVPGLRSEPIVDILAPVHSLTASLRAP